MNQKYEARWGIPVEKLMPDRVHDIVQNIVKAIFRPTRFLAVMLAVTLAWFPLRVNATRTATDPGVVASDPLAAAGRTTLELEALLAEPDSWMESLAFDADKRVAAPTKAANDHGHRYGIPDRFPTIEMDACVVMSNRFPSVVMDTFVAMPNPIHGIVIVVGAPLVGARPS